MFKNTHPDTLQIDLCIFFDVIRSEGAKKGVFVFHDEAEITGEVIKQIIAQINATPMLQEIEFVHPSYVLDFFLRALYPQISSDVVVKM